MFNDKYGLTEAVLNGEKTQTRRVINLTDTDKEYLDTAFDWDLRESVIIDQYAKYKVGEVIAVAQSYKDAGVGREYYLQKWENGNDDYLIVSKSAGLNNKMFVKAELMPHHIRITNIRVERLQDISDEDCLKEGIRASKNIPAVLFPEEFKSYTYDKFWFNTPREAYAALIDKVSGKGTWDENPYVFVYDFELVD